MPRHHPGPRRVRVGDFSAVPVWRGSVVGWWRVMHVGLSGFPRVVGIYDSKTEALDGIRRMLADRRDIA